MTTYIANEDEVRTVLATLKSDGIARWPTLIGSSDLSALRLEFDAALDPDAAPWSSVGHYRPGLPSRAVTARRDMLSATSAFAHIFGQPELEQVTRLYLGRRSTTTDAIFLTRDEFDPTPVTRLHYDRIHALKFFVYLDDTGVTDGAFGALRGSHRDGSRLRKMYLRRGVPVRSLPITEVDHLRSEATYFEGAAGTMLIFDTDTLHLGGVVLEGRTRRVARAHSHRQRRDFPTPPRRSRQWLREHRANPFTALIRAAKGDVSPDFRSA